MEAGTDFAVPGGTMESALKKKVLFLDTDNSTRSQMAEGILRKLH
jgi:hypothetical protein